LENKETLIINILKEAYPELDCSPGTPFYELAVRPMSYLWTRHEEGNAELTSGAYLENYATMSEEDWQSRRIFRRRPVESYRIFGLYS
jgi:hypothetical protein